jgi:hypothetical protein
MSKFRDEFTGICYAMGEKWLQHVRQDIAEQIKSRFNGDVKTTADNVAQFWSDYYAQIFPLRFGLIEDERLYKPYKFYEPTDNTIDLESLHGNPTRLSFLDGNKLPPLLPAADKDETNELLADHLLTITALANMLLRQEGNTSALHEVRLAFLTYPLMDLLEADLLSLGKGFTDTVAIAHFLAKKDSQLPSGINPTLLISLRDGANLTNRKIGLTLVAVRRIKQYVFETPGLNEIRGASTLLDDLTSIAKCELTRLFGPETVLRAVGSTLVFLAPTENDAKRLTEQIQRAYYQATGTAFTVTACCSANVAELLQNYSNVYRSLSATADENRAQAEQPIYEALPFETRCRMCRIRSAEGWEKGLPGETEPVPLCRVCKTKRELGYPEREGKATRLLQWLGLDDPQNAENYHPGALGVRGKKPTEFVAKSLGTVEPPEEGFIPTGIRRPLVATIYGDGNNFGAVGVRLESLALARQWTQRVERTTQAAAAIALARATQKTAMDRGWNPHQPNTHMLPKLPFQVLALGGDDMSLFAWAPVGVRFASHFLQMMDLEFQRASDQQNGKPPIAFSLGALLTHHKAAVRKTVAFTEDQLLEWAKRAFRQSKLEHGNIAMLLANTLEQIPDDLKNYRQRMYLSHGEKLTLCMTLRPFVSEELAWLLEGAQHLKGSVGQLHRLVSAFAKMPPHAAMLYYIYQRGRFERVETVPQFWLKQMEARPAPLTLPGLKYPATVRAKLKDRKPFGLEQETTDQKIWFTPLWDLLELVKVLE